MKVKFKVLMVQRKKIKWAAFGRLRRKTPNDKMPNGFFRTGKTTFRGKT